MSSSRSVRSFGLVRLAGVLGLVGCNDAVTLSISSDRPIPSAIDAMCVAVADADLAGGHFGQRYPLASLPQTLRLEAGGASDALAWVRADRSGVPVAMAARSVDFSDDVTLGLARCVRGAAGAPAAIGDPVGPANARLVSSQGQGGTVVVALGADEAAIIDARGRTMVASEAPAPGVVTAAIAVDIDGDCDDDVVSATASEIVVWRRDGRTFVEAARIAGGAAALAIADVDHDGAFDLIAGSGAQLALYRNDGGGAFSLVAGAIPVAGELTDVRAIATGDLDGDGNADFVVGQAGGPLRAWFGSGTGFIAAPGAVPAVSLDVVAVALVDADDDFDPDLAVAVRGAAMRLYIDREGRLEDQSFVRLPDPAPIADAIAIGGWDDGCAADAIAVGGSGAILQGTANGTFAIEGRSPVASSVVFADLDDDGDLDAIAAGATGVVWLAR